MRTQTPHLPNRRTGKSTRSSRQRDCCGMARRTGALMAAPVLDVGASLGLYDRAAGARHRLQCDPVVLPASTGRLHRSRAVHRRDDDAGFRRLGTPCDCNGPADDWPVDLQCLDYRDFTAEYGSGIRLDRHDLAWPPGFTTAFLFIAGFIVMFVIGGVSGVMTGVVPDDLQLTDTYWVVAHLHYVLIGINLFGVLPGIYYWFPKFIGRMLQETLRKVNSRRRGPAHARATTAWQRLRWQSVEPGAPIAPAALARQGRRRLFPRAVPPSPAVRPARSGPCADRPGLQRATPKADTRATRAQKR